MPTWRLADHGGHAPRDGGVRRLADDRVVLGGDVDLREVPLGVGMSSVPPGQGGRHGHFVVDVHGGGGGRPLMPVGAPRLHLDTDCGRRLSQRQY